MQLVSSRKKTLFILVEVHGFLCTSWTAVRMDIYIFIICRSTGLSYKKVNNWQQDKLIIVVKLQLHYFSVIASTCMLQFHHAITFIQFSVEIAHFAFLFSMPLFSLFVQVLIVVKKSGRFNFEIIINWMKKGI